MGLLQKALETYEAHAALAGQALAGHQPLAPVSHILANADLELTLDEQGQLLDVTQVSREDRKTIIPATLGSAGRTAAPCPHPLCEQVGYLSGQDPKKYALYLEQLQSWASSAHTHPMLAPVLAYVRRGTLLEDLKAFGVDQPGDKAMIRWRVMGIGPESGPCWTCPGLFSAFSGWYQEVREKAMAPAGLCMLTGRTVTLAEQHPKGIIPMNGNAKLISSNDLSNFTFRGRFTQDCQAATVGYEASQKAHNALRWLAAEQGARVVFGGRTFLCWNPQGRPAPHSNLPFQTVQTPSVTPSDYRAALERTLAGWQTQLPERCGGVAIAAFDAATTGRLALTYYSELRASDFLERLRRWDESCCWWGWNPESRRYNAIVSPPLWQIINCAFGAQREEKGKAVLRTDDRVMAQQMQRLVACRVDRARFPADIEQALVNRASHPQGYDEAVYRTVLLTACAVIRKYYSDNKKEELEMELQPEREDLSYQFGRLLAVLEKAERDTYDNDDGREPNAIRLQSMFCRRPLHTAKIVEAQLEQAYFPRLKPGTRAYYKKCIGQIMERIAAGDETQWNKPLGDTYLIGYYLQRSELYRSKEQKEREEQ